MKTPLIVLMLIAMTSVTARAQIGGVSTSTTWCVEKPVKIVNGNYEFYGADCDTLMRCPTGSIVLAGYDAVPKPAQFPDGIAVPIPDSGGAWYLIQPVADGEPTVALQVSHSPIGADWQALKAAGLAAVQAKRNARAAATNDYVIRKTVATNSANAAQTVPQMRQALLDLQGQIDALRAIVEAK